MTVKKRCVAGILAFVIMTAMLLSAAFIAAERHHDCTGENCPICEQIAVCQNTLNRLSYDGAAATAVIALTCVLLCLVQRYERYETHTTLVTLKVKLSD